MRTTKSQGRGTLYLEPAALQPFDVLLTRGAAKQSLWIAKLTSGKFSHAALVVNRWFLFESDDVGVGYTPLKIHRIECLKDKRKLLSELSDVDQAVILRHPCLDSATAESLENKLADALAPLIGLQYPEWTKLATALPGWALTQLGRLALSLVDIGDTKVVNPGPFCSQMVAAVLMDVLGPKLSVFVPSRGPETVSPNVFLSSELKPLKGVVGCADPHASLDKELQAQYDQYIVAPPRQEWTGPIVKLKATVTHMNQQVKDVSAGMAQYRKFIQDLFQQSERMKSRTKKA